MIEIDMKRIEKSIDKKIIHFSGKSIDMYNRFGNGKETKYCNEQVEFWERFETELKNFAKLQKGVKK